MEKIIQDLNEVLERGRILIRQHDQKFLALMEREKNLERREQAVRLAEDNHAERIAHCEKVENIEKMAVDAKSSMDIAGKRLEEVRVANAELTKRTAEEMKKLEDLREVNRKEEQAVQNQKRNIDAEVKKRVAACLSNMGLKEKA